jgi:hypothetical protein
MKREDDMDRLDEMLAGHLRREPASFDFEQWAHKFPEDAKLVRTGFARPVPNRRTQLMKIGRMIMTNRYTRLAGVAAVVLVGLAFLFPSGNGIVPESVAWADVQKAIEQAHSARVTGTRSCFFSSDETPTYKLGVEKLFSLSDGYVDRTFAEDGRLLIELAYDMPSGTATVLFPTYKRYYRTQVPAEFREKVKQATPEKFFEWLWASGDYRKVGPKEVQGVQAAGFEVSDLTDRFTRGLGLNERMMSFFLSFGLADACIWVNPKTRLPIQIEFEGQVRPCLLTGYRDMKLREIDDRWEFDIELDGAQFRPAIPQDYQELPVPVAVSVSAPFCVAGAAAPALLVARRLHHKNAKPPATS